MIDTIVAGLGNLAAYTVIAVPTSIAVAVVLAICIVIGANLPL